MAGVEGVEPSSVESESTGLPLAYTPRLGCPVRLELTLRVPQTRVLCLLDDGHIRRILQESPYIFFIPEMRQN